MYCQMSKTLFQNYFSILKHLHDFLTEKPGKPYFRKREKSDAIECISESYPQPSVEWIFCKTPEKRYGLCLYVCWISRLKVYHLLKKKGEALYCLVCLVSCGDNWIRDFGSEFFGDGLCWIAHLRASWRPVSARSTSGVLQHIFLRNFGCCALLETFSSWIEKSYSTF